MKALPFILGLVTLLVFERNAGAQVRRSASYAISAETLDGGGRAQSSLDYAGTSSLAGAVENASTAAQALVCKSGFESELYNVVGLSVTAASPVVDVGCTSQLEPAATLDDGTFLVLDPTTVLWSVQSGPITSISPGGLATAGIIYQDTTAQVSGSCDGFAASITVTVSNPAFAAWQTQYFGQNNPLGNPDVDADGNGETNLFKYIAGLDPTDPTSFFHVAIGAANAEGSETAITFSPVAGGRTYTVQVSSDLKNWESLKMSSQTSTGNTMTVIDINPPVVQRFYRVTISR